MTQNPYSLVFGKEPLHIITRVTQTDEVVNNFCSETPSQQIYMVTGVRGSGKTVFMTDVSKRLQSTGSWIVVELNAERDMLISLASKLCSDNSLARLFQSAKINLSLFGFGLEVTNTAPIADIETAISKMLTVIKKKNKRLLITVDEAVNNQNIRIFASAFQILIRQDLPLFLIMTGLYDNINSLQNEKNLTFLYRAPKLELSPLNTGVMAESYRKTLGIDTNEALSMARKTKGYPFAFQVLGYFTWQYKNDAENIARNFKQYLDDYVYEKIWSELSNKDKLILYGIASSTEGKISEVRDIIHLSNNEFNPYRKRLIKKGLINGDEYGYVRFTLPLFDRFVIENYDL